MDKTTACLTALATALCNQPEINGTQLRADFLSILDGLTSSDGAAKAAGHEVARLMGDFLEAAEPILITTPTPPY